MILPRLILCLLCLLSAAALVAPAAKGQPCPSACSSTPGMARCGCPAPAAPNRCACAPQFTPALDYILQFQTPSLAPFLLADRLDPNPALSPPAAQRLPALPYVRPPPDLPATRGLGPRAPPSAHSL